jgi:hypothetical protein
MTDTNYQHHAPHGAKVHRLYGGEIHMKLTACALLLLALLNFSSPPSFGQPPLSSSNRAARSATLAAHLRKAQERGARDELTQANWQQHPKIKAIRAIVQTVKTGLDSKAFKVQTREFEYCEPYEDALRSIARDARGRVRYYERQGGSEDSALKWQHYYDEAGRLRFVFITGGATNGAELEHRIYFDEQGKRIWEEHKYTKGPGYTFPEIWPAEQLQLRDAAAAFAAKSSCPEKRAKRRK